MNIHPNSDANKVSTIESGSTAINFELVAESSPDIIFIYDHGQRRHIYCNRRVTDLLGYSVTEFLSLQIHEKDSYINPDDHDRVLHWLEEIFKTTTADLPSIEYRARHRDGSWRWLKVRAANFDPQPDGGLQRIIGTGLDITEQMQMKQEQQRQTAILELILNSMTDGVMVCDASGQLILVNRSAEQILKIEQPLPNIDQLRQSGKSSADDNKLKRLWHQHPLLRSLRGEKVADYELSLFDRKHDLAMTLSHSSAPLKDTNGQIIGAVDVFRDVTDSRRALQELRRAEQHFRLLVDGTTDYAIFMLDQKGLIVSWNPGAERILGYRKAEIIGLPLSIFFTPEDQKKGEPDRLLSQTMKDGRSESDSWRVRKDGERFWCTGAIGALHDEDGKVQGFVEIMRDNTERRLAEQNTFFLANHDPLTGLANRARFLERLHETLINADRDNTRVAILLLDLDRFKSINDSLGHHVGDQLLKMIAQRLSSCVRETDTVARLGGDEFVVILTRLKSLSAAELLAANIIKSINRTCLIEGHSIKSSASVGIALYPQDGKEGGELLQKADLAMYRAKSAGRNHYRIFAPGMLTEIQLRQQQEEQLRLAVEQGDFELAYQPLIDVHSLDLKSIEALLRCRNPQLLTFSPQKIIAMAEELGISLDLCKWILRTACQQIKKWQAISFAQLKVSVNCSPSHLLSENFVALIQSMLAEENLEPHCLEIEVTENALMLISDNKSRVIHEIKALGVSISLDDFGTGLSTLSHLKEFPVDILKLDGSLIRNLPKDQEDVAIVSAIIKLAIDLGITVVAEGVETVEQLGFLRTTACHMVQGFLFSEALRSEKFELLLENRKRDAQIFH